jgi:SAM-dependent methyltransferase
VPDFPRVAPDVAPLKPRDADVSRPAAARAYDFFLGGRSNFEADREFGRQVLDQVPFVADFARNNRAFLRRAVNWLTQRGIDQFLDIGSGIPTVGNVHEIAQQRNPEARTVYVDYEPVAVAHSTTILDEIDPRRERTDVLQADLRSPSDILDHTITRNLLDFERPIGLLIVATLHFIGPGDRPRELIAAYRDALPSGSHLVLSHLTLDGVPERMQEQGRALEALYAGTPNPGYFRGREEFTALFGGFDVVDPGIVWAPEWHPDQAHEIDPASTATLTGVGVKR